MLIKLNGLLISELSPFLLAETKKATRKGSPIEPGRTNPHSAPQIQQFDNYFEAVSQLKATIVGLVCKFSPSKLEIY